MPCSRAASGHGRVAEQQRAERVGLACLVVDGLRFDDQPCGGLRRRGVDLHDRALAEDLDEALTESALTGGGDEDDPRRSEGASSSSSSSKATST